MYHMKCVADCTYGIMTIIIIPLFDDLLSVDTLLVILASILQS